MSDRLYGLELVEWARQKCDTADGCWIWQGGHNARGYPLGYMRGAAFTLRRRVYEATHPAEPLAAGYYVSLRCGQIGCLNPKHMRRVTRSQYMQAAVGGKRRSADVVAHVTAAQRRRRTIKMTLDSARELRRRVEAGASLGDVAPIYGISRANASLIVRNEIWREPSPWAI
jgi:hypothetical protein